MGNSIQSAAVSSPGKDDESFPICQITTYGIASRAVPIYPYGMHAVAPKGSYFLSFAVNGQQENKVGIPYNPALRQKELEEGEAIFGNQVTKSSTFYDEDGNIVINCEKDQKVTIKGDAIVSIEGNSTVTIGGTSDITVTGQTTLTTTKLTIDGDLTVTGDTTLSSTVTSNGKDISNTHTHVGSPTAPTGAVSPTGAPV